MSRKHDTMTKESYSCPNPSCGKSFPNPLKAKNLSVQKAKSYDACPYCLTEVNAPLVSVAMENEPKSEPKLIEIKEELVPAKVSRLKQDSAAVQNCAHHLGYLSERSKKEKIPEECMTCGNIVQCMLKTITG